MVAAGTSGEPTRGLLRVREHQWPLWVYPELHQLLNWHITLMLDSKAQKIQQQFLLTSWLTPRTELSVGHPSLPNFILSPSSPHPPLLQNASPPIAGLLTWAPAGLSASTYPFPLVQHALWHVYNSHCQGSPWAAGTAPTWIWALNFP